MAITIKKGDVSGSFTITDTQGNFVRYPAGQYILSSGAPGSGRYTMTESISGRRIISDTLLSDIINGDTWSAFATFTDLDTYIATNFFRKAGSGTGISPYLGQVATRSVISNTAESQTALMSRSKHIAKENLTSLKIVIPNWYASGTEKNNGGVATVTASIEYNGTFTRLNFSGATTGTIQPGANGVSDAAIVNIPVGATFFIRIFWQNPNGWYHNNTYYDSTGDALEFTTTPMVDRTMGGTVANQLANNSFMPIAILQTTTRKSTIMFSDSKGSGNLTTTDDGSGDLGNIAPSIGKTNGYINCSIGGDRADIFITSNALRRGLAQYCSHVVVNFGVNDANAGRSAAQIIADLTTIAGYFPTKQVIGATIEPGASQTVLTPVNRAIRGPLPGYATSVDISDIVSLDRDSGTWKTGYANADGVHYTNVGSRAVKNSGLLNIALLSV